MLNESLRDKLYELRAELWDFRMKRDMASLMLIQNRLNDIFNESKCKQLIYTENTDKMFFGVYVDPVIPIEEITDLLMGDDNYIVKEYYVELDSKLFDSKLTMDEITACVIQNVGCMVADSKPMKKAIYQLDLYLSSEGTTLKLTESVHYLNLLAFGIKDAMRKMTSMFYMHPGDIGIYDSLMSDLDMLTSAQTAIMKLRSEGKINTDMIEAPIVVLSFIVRLYNDILKFRVDAMDTIDEAIKLSPSKYEKKELKGIKERLARIDDSSILEETTGKSMKGLRASIENKFHKYKRGAIQGYEDDFYEIQFQYNNMETQEDALLLIHQINSRMSVIQDYLENEKMNSMERKQFEKLYDDYNELRMKISKSRIYQNKTRLYVNYGYDD